MVMRHPWEKGEEVEGGLDGYGEAANDVLGEKLRTGGDEAVHAGQRASPRLQAHQPCERVAARLRNTAINRNSNSQSAQELPFDWKNNRSCCNLSKIRSFAKFCKFWRKFATLTKHLEIWRRLGQNRT